PGREDVLALNLAAGCGHRCAFCSARAYPNYRGDDVVTIFADTASRLNAELTETLHQPKAVLICPSTDPFPRQTEIQQEAARVVEVLARHGVEAWLMTRGFLRGEVLETLTTHADKVRITMGFTTVDPTLQRILEPEAAPARLRLRQIKQLRA